MPSYGVFRRRSEEKTSVRARILARLWHLVRAPTDNRKIDEPARINNLTPSFHGNPRYISRILCHVYMRRSATRGASRRVKMS